MRTFTFSLLIFFATLAKAQDLKQEALERVHVLDSLIAVADATGLDATKEKMTSGTAKDFLTYADWDEANEGLIAEYLKSVLRYKKIADETAKDFADRERREVIQIVNKAIAVLLKLQKGTFTRNPSPKIDWAQVFLNNRGQFIYEGKPVFLSDLNTPTDSHMENYHGDLDGVYINPNKVTSAEGDLAGWFWGQLQIKGNGTFGQMFIGNTGVQAWAKEKYGEGFFLSDDRYTHYDIDNPGAREIMSLLMQKVAPQAAGKNYSKMGYLLCNEPHFYTTKAKNTFDEKDWDWASSPVSEYTKDKFRVWLHAKHKNIDTLNALWNSSFASFDDVTIDIPIYRGLRGTPKWYDWVTFNRYRVTQWYSDVRDTIHAYDPNARTQIKLMPGSFTGNKRGHGIDYEALSELTEIMGNDAGTIFAPMWGTYTYPEHYSYEWSDIFMGIGFQKSVCPNKAIFNSETHYFETGASKRLTLSPLYARNVMWASTIEGCNANLYWRWVRQSNGAILEDVKSSVCSFSSQPAVTNEITATIMDMNAHSKTITKMMNQRRPIRMFYSATSATNKTDHMDGQHHLYEALHCNGVPIGFATKKIISRQDNSQWDVILIYKTEYITQEELDTLQNYLNNGGTIILDNVSLTKDEYGRALSGLTAGTGQLIKVSSMEQMVAKALETVEAAGEMPEITITETNSHGMKACNWRTIKDDEGNIILSLVNVGKSSAELIIKPKNIANFEITDLLDGSIKNDTLTIPKFGVLFYKIAPYKELPETPTRPQNLTISNLTQNSCVLRWDASSDKEGVAGYMVKQDDVYLQTVTSTYTKINNLACNTSYSFTVVALDNDGNKSDISAPAAVTTRACDIESIHVGNDFSLAGTADGWRSNMVINETDIYSNNTGAAQTISLDKFNFYAQGSGDPLTPFVVKVNGDNDFTVLAIGETRTNSDYKVGSNSLDFSTSTTSLTLADGDTIALGFLDAFADGSGGGGSSVIPFTHGGDEIWYSGGPEGSTSGSVSLGVAPTAGESAITTLTRSYHFGMSLFNSSQSKPKPKVYFKLPLKNRAIAVDSSLLVNIGAQSDTGIAQVQLFLNNELLGQKHLAPYQWGKDDTLFQNMQAGLYTLKAIAQDSGGITSETSMQVHIAVAQKPTISFKTPVNHTGLYLGSDVHVLLDATSDFGLANVKLYLNEQMLGQQILPPFTWGENEALLQNLQKGTYTLKAVAENSLGLVADTSIQIIVAQKPDIAFLTPHNNDTLKAGTNVSVQVNAQSDKGIANIKLYLNQTLVSTKEVAPYTWGEGDALLENLAEGVYTLKAVAEDSLGLRADTSIQVSIDAPVKVNEVSANHRFKVFPNPTKHQLTMQSEITGAFKLYIFMVGCANNLCKNPKTIPFRFPT